MTQPDLSQIEADLAKLPKMSGSFKESKQYTPDGPPLLSQHKLTVQLALVKALRHLEEAVQQPGTVDSMLIVGDTLTITYKLDLGASTVDIEVKLTAKEAMK